LAFRVFPISVARRRKLDDGQNVSVGIAEPRNLGAGRLTVLRRVTLPLALPGIVAGTVLVFILCMNAYATPVLLGGPSFRMMAPALYDQMTKANNWPFGAALAFVLMAATLLLTLLASVGLQRRYRAA